MENSVNTAAEPAKSPGRASRAVTALGKACIDRWVYFAVFFLSVGIMYGSYAFFKVYPIGESSALVLDLNGQYVYYYEHYRDAFYGKASWIYSWSRNLSGELFGVFAYYLASPFMIIIALLPRAWMPTSILIMQLAKIGAASVTFCYFIKKMARHEPTTLSLIVFPLMYSLCSYMVVQLMDPMWLDGLIYLPLICVGVHKLVHQGRLLPYIIPLALMFIAHFYIGYMVGIFTFFYFCYTCLGDDKRVLPKKFFLRCVQFGLGTFIALMCSAWVLIPVYNSLKLGKFEFTDPDFSLATQFDFLTFITKLFPMTYDTVYPEGMPMIYCGTAVLILVPLFFMNERISVKEKTANGLLTVILTVLMYIKPADMAMHGFQVPNWLPFRYSFIFSFMMLFMAFRAFEELKGITAKNIGGVVFGLTVFLFWCERENYDHFRLFISRKDSAGETYNVIQGVWFSMIAIAVYFMFIYLVRKYPGSKAVAVCMSIVVAGEMFADNIDTIKKIDLDVAYSKYTSYEPYMSNLRAAVSMMKEFDHDPFYRMEATFHRTVNDAIGTGYYSVSHSSSTMNAPALLMLHRLGYAYGGHYTKYDGATPLTDAVFDIKYVMDEEGTDRFKSSRIKIPSQYKLTTELTRDGTIKAGGKVVGDDEVTFKFYQNPNALGLGIVSKGDIGSVELNDDDPFDNQNRLFNALAGEELNCFERLEVINSDVENVVQTNMSGGHIRYTPQNISVAECHIDYVVRMSSDGPLYMFLPTKYERSCNIWYQLDENYEDGKYDMEYVGQFFTGDNYSIMKIGDFYEGQDVRVRITVSNDDNEAFWRDKLFYTFDYDKFAAACAVMKKQSLQITHFEDTALTGTAESDADGRLLFTTVPYEEGWSITVNGKKTEPVKTLDSLIAIPLEEGTNTVSMEFSPNYWKVSLIITIFGLTVLAVTFLFEFRNGRVIRKLLSAGEKPENALPPQPPEAIIKEVPPAGEDGD